MSENKDIEEIFSKSVRAGRRTYFFDVRSTRADDYYMTITESKRDFNQDGSPFYKKHKIYLYKEDFAKFKEALSEVSNYIISEKGEEIISNKDIVKTIEGEKIEDALEIKPKINSEIVIKESSDFTEVNFDDLGKD